LEKNMQVRPRNPALQYGLIFGVVLGLVEIAVYYLVGAVIGAASLLINLILLLLIAGYAGYRASTRTGKISTGLVAGLLAGLFSSVIASLPLIAYYLSNIDALRVQLQQQMAASSMNQGVTLTNSLVVASVILFMVVLVIGATLVGLAAGSVGGAMGKGQAQQQQQLPPMPQYPYPMPPYQQQQYTPQPPPQSYQPLHPDRDYTSPEAYMTPQENTPPPGEAGH
jgi:hypothetical protein